jgi:hypothetical protein
LPSRWWLVAQKLSQCSRNSSPSRCRYGFVTIIIRSDTLRRFWWPTVACLGAWARLRRLSCFNLALPSTLAPLVPCDDPCVYHPLSPVCTGSWWWPAVLIPASGALGVLFYSLTLLQTHLTFVDRTSQFVFVCGAEIGVVALAALAGPLGHQWWHCVDVSRSHLRVPRMIECRVCWSRFKLQLCSMDASVVPSAAATMSLFAVVWIPKGPHRAFATRCLIWLPRCHFPCCLVVSNNY